MNHRLNRFFKTLIFSLFYTLSLLKSLLSKTLIQPFSLHSMLFDYDNENDDVWGAPLALPFTPPNDDPQLYLVHDRYLNLCVYVCVLVIYLFCCFIVFASELWFDLGFCCV